MTFDAHRHLKSVSAEIDPSFDGTVKPISAVYADLELNKFRPGYDAAAVEELVARPHLFQQHYHHPFAF